MSLPRYAARRDENEPLIIEVLEASGWGVFQASAPGFPDLVCAKGQHTILIEVVGDAKAAKFLHTKGLTPTQVHFHEDVWPGVIYIVRTVEDVLAVIASRI